MVRRKDDLKRISGVCDGIIFDDVDLSTWTPEDTICLLDWDETRSLPARYSDAQLEADIPMTAEARSPAVLSKLPFVLRCYS